MNSFRPVRSRACAAVALAVLSCFLAPSMALAADNYGAIAYSKSSGAYGYSYDFGSREAAEERALSECRARGDGCKIRCWSCTSR